MNFNGRTIFEAIVVGVCLTAIGASAKAIVDVAVLQENKQNVHEDIQEIKQDIRSIKNYLIPNRRR